MTVHPDDRILAVVPERCSGPGWASEIVWVYIRRSGGRIEQDVLQPDEQGRDLRLLFSVGDAVHRALMHALPRAEGK